MILSESVMRRDRFGSAGLSRRCSATRPDCLHCSHLRAIAASRRATSRFLDAYAGMLGDRLIPIEPGLVAAQ